MLGGGLISFVLPAVGDEWYYQGADEALGSIGLLGMGLGAVFGGTLRSLGRKRVFTTL